MSVVVLDFLVLPLTQNVLMFLPRGSESWVLAICGRNFINGPPKDIKTLSRCFRCNPVGME